MKRLTLLKYWSDEAFNTSSSCFIASSLHRFIASSLSTLQKYKLKSSYNECESKDDDIFRLCYGNIGNLTKFFDIANINHRFFSLIIFVVKALRQLRQIWEAMKRENVNYGKKLKQWSDEAFNASKEIEAMKRLTLHRIASSLHGFMASSLLVPSFEWNMQIGQLLPTRSGENIESPDFQAKDCRIASQLISWKEKIISSNHQTRIVMKVFESEISQNFRKIFISYVANLPTEFAKFRKEKFFKRNSFFFPNFAKKFQDVILIFFIQHVF